MAFRKVSYQDKDNHKISVVEPIRKKSDIRRICNWFMDHDLEKYAILFKLGCYTGLRASDVLQLKVNEVYHKDKVIIREQKTGKVKMFVINPRIKPQLNNYIERRGLSGDMPVFEGRGDREVDRSQVYRFIVRACEELGIEDNVGTHTMRKTFGYHAYRQFHDMATIQFIFNHTSPDVTLRYLGVTQDEADRMYINLDLEHDEETLEDMIIQGVGKPRIQRIAQFCKSYLSGVTDGVHTPFALMILELCKSTPKYSDWKAKQEGMF